MRWAWLAEWSRGGVDGQVLHGLSRAVTVCSYLGHFQKVQSISCNYKKSFSENIIKYNKQAKAQQTNCFWLLAYYDAAKSFL